MVTWEVTGAGLRVRDRDNTEVRIGAPDVDVLDDGEDLPRPVDATVTCRARTFRFPMAIVYVAALGTDEQYELGAAGSLDLSAGEYVVDVDTEIKLYLHCEGPMTVEATTEYDGVVVSFPDPREVVLGVRSRHDAPPETVVVPDTPEGVATFLSHSHAGFETSGPDRSYPTLRGHPPLVALGDETTVPGAVGESTADTGIELVAPPDVETLYVLAPLAHYLQASVRIDPHRSPTVRAPAAGVEHALPDLPRLQDASADLLRTVFFMDTLVRNAGPHGTTLAETSMLDALGMDAETLYERSAAERLAAYLDVPSGAVEQRRPDWHLSTYVDPGPEHLQCLPYLLADLCLVYLPRTSELAGSELVERSLDDFYRGGDGSVGRAQAGGTPPDAADPVRGAGDVASVDIVKPELRGGRVHGWLADGVPIDVFKSSLSAYRNREHYGDRESDATRITVVLNDADMRAERDVEDIYRARAEDVPLTVSVRERLPVAELARVFEGENAFVHFIGHCETDGLRCPDGYLSAASLDACNAETFFLNACGSYHEGTTLVEKGSVTGAVTFSQVLNDQAVKVGSTFAQLLVHGFGFERAMRLARRRIMMGKDYAVVGDGTHVLTQCTNRVPATVELEALGDDRYLLSYDQFSTHHIGGFYRPHVPGNEFAYLCGNESDFVLERAETESFLERADLPVIYDGDVYWSDDLHQRLSD